MHPSKFAPCISSCTIIYQELLSLWAAHIMLLNMHTYDSTYNAMNCHNQSQTNQNNICYIQWYPVVTQNTRTPNSFSLTKACIWNKTRFLVCTYIATLIIHKCVNEPVCVVQLYSYTCIGSIKVNDNLCHLLVLLNILGFNLQHANMHRMTYCCSNYYQCFFAQRHQTN